MDAVQDNVFCVPVYEQAESASQAEDHSKLDQEVSEEIVPLFSSSWREKSRGGLQMHKQESFTNGAGSLDSTLSSGPVDYKRHAQELNSADVRLVLQDMTHSPCCCSGALYTCCTVHMLAGTRS